MFNRSMFKNRLLGNIVLLVSGTGLAQLIPFLFAPLLTRLYSPSDFGLFAIFIGLSSIISIVSTGRYELGLILPKQSVEVGNLFFLCLIILLLVAFFAQLVVFIIVPMFSLNAIYILVPATVFFLGLNNSLDKYNNRYSRYRSMSFQRLVKVVVELAVSVGLIYWLGIVAGMIYGVLAGYIIASLVMLLINRREFFSIVGDIDAKSLKKVAVKYIKFPKYSMPHGLLNSLSSNLPVFLIPFYYDNAVLGFYAFGIRIMLAPIGLVSNAIYSVLGQKLAQMDPGSLEIKIFFKKAFKIMLIASLLLSVVVYFGGGMFGLLFGDEWQVAGEYVQILTPWLVLVFLNSPFASLPIIFKAQKKALVIEIVGLILKVFVLLLGGAYLEVELTLGLLALVSVLVILYILKWYFGLINRTAKDSTV